MSKASIAALHYLALFLMFSSPFWLKWYWIIIGAVLYNIIIVRWVGYCPLTKIQYGDTSTGFIEKNLRVIFRLFHYQPNQQRLELSITYGIPVALITTAILWQLLVW